MYRVFEALDELSAIIEEARGVPMTSGCVVPRGDVLDLLDEIREAFPSELDNAQDVLDQQDELLHSARVHAEQAVSSSEKESATQLSHANAEAGRIVAEAQNFAERTVAEATARADQIFAEAKSETQRLERTAAREYESVTGRARAEAQRLVDAGNATYDRSVNEALSEQHRLVSENEVVQAARKESERIIDSAHAEAERLHAECDSYVDDKLAEFEEFLTQTVRSVGRGRKQLRTNTKLHDFVGHQDIEKTAS